MMALAVLLRQLEGKVPCIGGSTKIPFFACVAPMDTKAAAWPCRNSTAGKRARFVRGSPKPSGHGHHMPLARAALVQKVPRTGTYHYCSPAARTGHTRPRAGALTATRHLRQTAEGEGHTAHLGVPEDGLGSGEEEGDEAGAVGEEEDAEAEAVGSRSIPGA